MATATDIQTREPARVGPSGSGASGSGVSAARLSEAVAVVGAFVDAFEPARYSGEDAEALVGVFTTIERYGVTGKALAATRATEANRHTLAGHRTPAEWLAARTGESLGSALDTLSLGEGLDGLPGMGEALRRGELAPARAAMIARAAKDRPDKVGELIEGARTDSFRQLRDRCAKTQAEGRSPDDEAAVARSIHRRRYARVWRSTEGAVHLEGLFTPMSGARLLASLQDQADRLFADRSKQGLTDPADALRADALVALVTGQGILPSTTTKRPGKGSATTSDSSITSDSSTCTCGGRTTPRTALVIRADLDALRRGSVGEGELCEIPGVGPIPVARAHERLGEDLAHLVITNGVDVTTVCGLGRHIPEALRVAITERDQCCVVPGCGVRLGLEIDHWQVDYAKGGPTTLANLCRLCTHHHRLKTHQGYRLHRSEAGTWQFLPPETTKTPARPKRKQPPRRRTPLPGDPDPPLFEV